MNSEFDKILESWHRRVKLTQIAHYQAAHRVRRFHMILGIGNVILSSLIAVTIFATAGEPIENELLLMLGSLTLLASIVASLNVFLGFATRAELHLAAARQYGKLRRTIENALVARDLDDTSREQLANTVVEQLNELAMEDPPVSKSIWTQLEIEQEFEDRKIPSLTQTDEESIISTLQAHGDLPLGYVARVLGLTQSQVLELVERLSQQGLVDVKGGIISLADKQASHG